MQKIVVSQRIVVSLGIVTDKQQLMRGDCSSEACTKSLMAVRDTLDVLNGKWKLPIIIALDSGPKRFNELERLIEGITPKLLSKELRDLEANEFITRTVYPTTPVKIEYALTDYSDTLSRVIEEMRDWGVQHRKRITGK